MGVGEHTPGPWAVVEEDHDISVSGEGWFEDQNVNGWIVVGNLEDPTMAIAVIDTGYKNNWNDDKLDATAALVAAAPDLLAALEWLHAGKGSYVDPAAAIAKARGLSQDIGERGEGR
jgi:hypothetical protein